VLLAGAGRARAGQILYGTSLEDQRIVKVDTGTNSVTTVFNTVGTPDSLVFDTSGDILYTNLGSGQVRMYNPNTLADTLIAGGFSDPADLILEPGGGTILVSDFAGGTITRVNLTTHVKTVLGNYGGNPEGLAYDSAGRLFANLGVRDGANDKYVAQLDPVTGAILNTSAHLESLDGLTYDASTGKLYAAGLNQGVIYQVDPNTLAASALANSGVGLPDGLTTDGNGVLYIPSRSDFHIYRYDTSTHTLTQQTFVHGLDDLAPASGLGSPAPEPTSFVLLGIGAVGLGMYRRRARRATA
jgi:sugar lactone lactonase YvrE